jgi:hypothetical protein
MLYQDTLGPWLRRSSRRSRCSSSPSSRTPQRVRRVQPGGEAPRLVRGAGGAAAVLGGCPVHDPQRGARPREPPIAIDGGDDLVVPLNVLIGGRPQASADGLCSSGRGDRCRRPVASRRRASSTVLNQRRLGTLSAEGRRRAGEVLRPAGAVGALGARREGRRRLVERRPLGQELADELYALSRLVTKRGRAKQLTALGVDPDEYDVDRTLRTSKTVARRTRRASTRSRSCSSMRRSTRMKTRWKRSATCSMSRRALALRRQARRSSLPWRASLRSRPPRRWPVTGGATKTWVVTSGNPRASHAAMNGETVPLDDTFSNGAKWPGDSSALDVDEIAGCNCDVEINLG